MKLAFRRRTQAPKPHSCFRTDEYADVVCEVCCSGERPGELLLCDKCDRGHHLFCLRSILVAVPKGSWFCPSCSNNKQLFHFPLIQTKIVDFFRIQRNACSIDIAKEDGNKKRKRTSNLVLGKKKRKLLEFNPSHDPTRRLEQMASLGLSIDGYQNEV